PDPLRHRAHQRPDGRRRADRPLRRRGCLRHRLPLRRRPGQHRGLHRDPAGHAAGRDRPLPVRTPEAPVRLRPLTRPLAAAAVAALTLPACGSGDRATDEGSAGEDGGQDSADATAAGAGTGGLEQITVGVLPIVDTAAIYLGVDQGFYEEEGLDVELEVASGGAAVAPGLTSG